MAAEDVSARFDAAVKYVKELPKDGPVQLDSAAKLKFYGLYKQATVGKCSEKGGSQPWAVQVEARAKWDAWNAVGDTSADEAKAQYVALLVETTAGHDQGFK